MFTISLGSNQEKDVQLFLNRWTMQNDLNNVYEIAREALKYGADPIQALETIKIISQQYFE